MGRIIRVGIYSAVLILSYLFIMTYVNSCQNENKENKISKINSDQILEDVVEEQVENDSLTHEVDYGQLDEDVKIIENTQQATKSKNEQESKNAKKATTSIDKGDGGPYMVLAGSYLIENNASMMVKKLVNMGWVHSEVVVFDKSEYHTVVAARFRNEEDAKNVVSQLQLKGIDSFVKKQR